MLFNFYIQRAIFWALRRVNLYRLTLFYTFLLKSKKPIRYKNAASAVTWAVPDAGASLPASEEAGQSTDDAVQLRRTTYKKLLSTQTRRIILVISHCKFIDV